MRFSRQLALPQRHRFVVAFIVLALAASSPAQTVINIPPSPSPASAGANTVVNLLPGGTLASFFQTLNGGVLNIQGGTAFYASVDSGSQINMTSGEARGLTSRPGSQLHVLGGRILESIQAEGVVEITGGRIDLLFDTGNSANISVSGGAIERIDVRHSPIALEGAAFAIDGIPISGLNTVGDMMSISVPVNSVLTGVLADGRAFAHHHPEGYTEPFEATLVRSATPPPPSPSEIHVSNESALEWVGDGQTLFVENGGTIGQQFRAGPNSRIEVSGGYIREAFHAVDAEVELNSGTIARRSRFFDGTTVNVHGGLLEDNANFYSASSLDVYGGHVAGAMIYRGATGNVHNGSVYRIGADVGGVVNIHGGTINFVGADDGGTLNFYGGNMIDRVDATGAAVNLYGGAFTDIFDLRTGSQLTVHASEIRLNGNLVSGLVNPGDMNTIAVGSGGIISGVFTNGTPFVLGGQEYNLPSSVKLVKSAAYTSGPSTIHVPTDAAPQGVHNGQTLILNDGGSLPINFTAGPGSAVNLQGGTVGSNFEAAGATVDITGGEVSTIDAFADAIINISGDVDWSGLELFRASTANISGGIYNGGNWFRAHPGSTLNITGGELRGQLEANAAMVTVAGGQLKGMTLFNRSSATISGGRFSGGIGVSSESELHFTGGTVAGLTVSSGDSDPVGTTTPSVRIAGGKVESLFVHGQYSEVEVVHGNIGNLDSNGGKTTFLGGALGDRHAWNSGTVELHGYDFQVNGATVAGLPNVGSSTILNYTSGTTITGTLSDGTPFNLAPNDNSQGLFITNGVLRLVRSDVPELPTTINVPTDPAPYGASAGQTVILHDGGALGDNFLAGRGSIVEIRGGTVGDNFEAERSDVTITGGSLGNRMDVFQGAEVTVTGGAIGNEIEIQPGGVLYLEGGRIGQLGKAIGGQLNMSGGSLGSGFRAQQGSTISISGGSVDNEFHAEAGSTVSVSGGQVGSNFEADNGSQVDVSGGQLRALEANSGANVRVRGGNLDFIDIGPSAHAEITGGTFGVFTVNSSADAALAGVDFELSGVPIAGLAAPGDQIQFNLTGSQLLTGTLADGTPFAFHPEEGDSINSLRIVRSADPPAGQSTIQVPSDTAPGGVRAGQQLALLAGGSLPSNFNAGRGSVVNIMGGTVGPNFEAFHAVVNIHGGQVGDNLDAFLGSQINILGGVVGTNFDAYNGSQVNVDGGSVARIDALGGSAVSMSSGQIASLQASNGSHTVWTGGSIASVNVSGASSTLDIHGAEFQLNGAPIAGLENVGDSVQFNLPTAAFLTATLSDGTPVLLHSNFNSPASNAQIANGTLTLVRSADTGMPGPAFQQVSNSDAPFAIGEGQTLRVVPGGVLPGSFIAGPGSKLLLDGGSTGSNLKAFGGEVDVSAGALGPNFIGLQDVDLTISGGTIGSGFSLFSGAHAAISGGTLPTTFRIDAGAEVDIYGTSFLLNNQPIAGLNALGDSLLLTSRGGQLLKVILRDGSLLQWQLTSPISSRVPFGFSSQAALRLHFVPEPASAASFLQILVLLGACRLRRIDHTNSQF